MGQIDDVLDEQEEQQSPIDAALDRADQANQARARRALVDTSSTNPDQAAEARRLSIKFGTPPAIIQRNLEQFKKREIGDRPYAKIASETPALSSWIEEPDNAAVAHDDLEQLGFLEWIVTAPGRAFSQGLNQVRQGQLATKELLGHTLTPEERDLLASYKFHTTEGGELGASASWFRGAVTGGARLLPNLIVGAEYAAKSSAALAIGGGVAGFAVAGPPGAIAGASAGAKVGAVYGGLSFGFDLEAGLAYQEFREYKDPITGQQIDQDAARMAALAAGAINSAFELAQFKILAKSIPGLDKLKGNVARAAIKEALRKPTVLAGLAQVGKSYAGTLGAEATTEAAQRAVTVLAEELAKGASGLEGRTAGQIAGEAAQEFTGALQAFALLPLPGAALQVGANAQAAQRAQQNVELFTVLAEGVQQSKTVQRSPAAAQAFLERALADGPIAEVTVDRQVWDQYWQDKNVDPAEMAQEIIGSSEPYDLAAQTGVEIVIPTSAYAVKLAGTEHNAFFAQELRLHAGEMNGREAVAFAEQLKAQEAAAKPPATDERAERYAATVDQLVTGGKFRREDAETLATTLEAFESLGERAGVDLGYTVDVSREGFKAEAPAVADDDLTLEPAEVEALDRRKTVEPAPGSVERRSAAEPLDANAMARAELEAEARGMDVGAGGGQATLEALRRDPTLRARAEALRASTAPRGKAKAPSAVFLAHGPDGPLYNIVGGEKDRSTVGAAALEELGIAIPETPADTGERLSGDQIRQRLIDARAAAEETKPDDTGTEGARAEDGPQRRISIRRIEASARESRRESVSQRQERRRKHYAAVFSEIKKAAKELDPGVDVKELRKEFNDRVEMVESLDEDFQASGENPRTLLQRIAEAGGISIDFESRRGGLAGELRWIKESKAFGPFGAFGGVRGVFTTHQTATDARRRSGLSLDEMTTALQGDPRFTHIETLDDLLGVLEDVARLEDGFIERTNRFPGTEELRRRAGIDPNRDWWKPAEEQQFNQGLFDEEPPAADVLDTGEEQPRLPGDVGAVRETEVATPELEAPFALTSPVSKAKGKQTTLFQDAIATLEPVSGVVPLPALARAVPFPYISEAAADRLVAARDRDAPVERRRVLLRDLVATQATITEGVAREYAAMPGDDVPTGIEANGIVYLTGGHHRAVGAWSNGVPSIDVDVQLAELEGALETQGAYTTPDQARELFQLEGFYSRLRRAVETVKQDKATGAQWKAMIRNAKAGINAEEFALAHVEDLDAGKSYTRAEVLEYLALNEVVIEDVTLSREGDQAAIAEAADKIYDEMIERDDNRRDKDWERARPDVSIFETEEEIEDDDGNVTTEKTGRWTYSLDGKDAETTFLSAEAAEAAVDEEVAELEESFRESWDDWEASRDEALEQARENLGGDEGLTQYHEYVEEGRPERDKTYREIFLTAPNLRAPKKLELAGITPGERTQLEAGGWAQFLSEKVEGNLAAGHEGAARAALEKAIRDIDDGKRTFRYSQLALEQVDRERKILEKLSRNLTTRDADDIVKETITKIEPPKLDGIGRGLWHVWTSDQPETEKFHIPAATEDEARRQAQQRIDSDYEGQKFRRQLHWEDGHDLYKFVNNPIVRLRLNERETYVRPGFGNRPRKVLFIEEIQPPAPGEQEKMPDLFTANWRELGLKYALRYATEVGADFVAWTTGKQQQERYALTRVVEKIEHTPQTRIFNGASFQADRVIVHLTQHVETRPNYIQFYVKKDGKNRGQMFEVQGTRSMEFEGKQLEEAVGPELAEQILSSTEPGEIAGEGLEIGGKGLAKLYDVDFRNIAQKLPVVKKLGGRVGTVPIQFGTKRVELGDGADYVADVVDVQALEITPEMKAAIEAGGQALFQEQGEKRGSIRFGKDRQFHINLFAKADLSTFLHETGHMFLEVFGDVADKLNAMDPATLTASQRKVLEDYQTALAFLGVERREQLATKEHEKWANAFEDYLHEGKAPSVELRSAFATFRAWLIGVYRALKRANAAITDDVRGVFDRLLATDDQIATAEAEAELLPMFATREDAGMSAERFELYRATMTEASKRAQEALQVKLLAELTRAQSTEYKRRREEVEADIANGDVYHRPVYLALSAMQRGTFPDGTPLDGELADPRPIKLSRKAIVDQFGKARLATLPKPYVYTRTGGITPDAAAEMFGFSSGDELLTAIAQAPPMKDVIRDAVDRRMIEDYGSMLLDGSIAEKARAALANDDREKIIKLELRALAELKRTTDPFVRQARTEERRERDYERRWFEAEEKLKIAIVEGRKQAEIDVLQDEVDTLKRKAEGGPAIIAAAIPPDSLIRDRARAVVAATRIRDLKPALYWQAARKASRLAVDAAARQDFNDAIAAKQQELISLALFRESAAALEDAQDRARSARDLSRPSTQKRLGLVDRTFLEQVNDLLSRYEFAEIPAKQLEDRVSLRKWIAAMEGEGLAVEIADAVIDDSRRINYRELRYEELVGVSDALKHIAHLAGIANRQQATAAAEKFAELRDRVAASIYANSKTAKLPVEFDVKEERRRGIRDWFASHTKIATLARALDGHQDGGALWEALIRPLNAAADAEQTRSRKAMKEYSAIITKHYPGREMGRLQQKTYIQALGMSLSKEARLAVALNWGNQTSRDRLLNDPKRRWSTPQIEAIIDTLDKRDMDFVQATFDYVNTFWPEIVAKQERVVGLAPEKVEGIPIVTRHGTYRGGYYPLKYDSRLSIRAMQNEAANDAKLGLAAAYVRTTTKRGHIEARQKKVKLSVRLDLGVAGEHIQQVIHDLTHHEALLEATRLLRDSKVSNAILETKTDVVYQQFTRALQDIAIGHMTSRNRLDRAANWMRGGTQIALLGWNVWTAAQQPLGLFNGMRRVGAVYVARGMKRWLRDAASMEATTTWIYEVSPFMRERGNTATQDIAQLKQAYQQAGGWFDNLVRTVSADTLTQQHLTDSYLWHIGLMQKVADVPTWLGMYEKAIANGADEAGAIAQADQAVIDSQGSGLLKDLSQLQRGGALAKLWMMFYTYGATIFNETSDVVGTYRSRDRSLSSVTTLLGHLLLLYLAPAMATVALANAFGRRDDDDAGEWLAAMGSEMLSTALNTMVVARELGFAARSFFEKDTNVRGYGGPAGLRPIDVFYKLSAQAKQGELDDALLKALNQAGGILFRYPAAQVERTVEGSIALAEGRTKNPAAILFGPPKER